MTAARRFPSLLRIAFVILLALVFGLVAPASNALAADGDTSSAANAVSDTQSGSSTSSTSYTLPYSEIDTSSATVNISADNTSGLAEDASFGFENFSRLNKGTDKKYNDTYYGYHYSMAAEDAFMVIVVPEETTSENVAIVYIPSASADRLGIDISDESFQQTFVTTLISMDSANANGGKLLTTIEPDFMFTSDNTVTIGDYTYQFPVQIEEGYYYGTVTLAGSETGADGGLFAETGTLQAASDLTIVAKSTGFAALKEFLVELDWRPLWVSLKTTGVALAFIFVFGLLAAWGTINSSDKFKGVFDTVFTIPMVLPPTVVGFLLLMMFGRATALGRWFIAHGIDIVFTWPAAVIACAVVGFPLLYRTARGAFENLDPMMLDAARTLGWGEWRIFRQLMLPLAWPSIAAGTVLGFARAMGEFGATLFFAGNFAGITQTIPIAIYFDWMAGDTKVAIFWVIVVILISFLVILFINIYSSHTQRYRVGGKRRHHRKDADDEKNEAVERGFELEEIHLDENPEASDGI